MTEIESPAAAVAEIVEAVDRPRQLPRVVQTQIDVGYTLGLATARAADEVNGVDATATATPDEPSDGSTGGGNSATGNTMGTEVDDVAIAADPGAGDVDDGDDDGDNPDADADDATAGAAAG